MIYILAAGGNRPTIALVSFDPSLQKLEIISENNADGNNSSIAKAVATSSAAYTIMDDTRGNGAAVSLIQKDGKLEVTATRKTIGGSAHVHCLKDGSGIIYSGGSVVFFPFEVDGTLSQTSESPLLQLPSVYGDGQAPSPKRQTGAHAHQCIEGKQGELFVPDLGSDRVWILNREGSSGLAIRGYLQAPAGSGPRHAIVSPDLKHLYLLTEMGHAVYGYSVDDISEPRFPIPGFALDIVPPSVPAGLKDVMNAAEISNNPIIPNVLYASNRYEMHLKERNGHDLGAPIPPLGDAVCIILLSQDGAELESATWVRTGCDTIRALSVSPDGKFAAVAGQIGGGLEVYAINGTRGNQWDLAAKLAHIEGVVDICWL